MKASRIIVRGALAVLVCAIGLFGWLSIRFWWSIREAYAAWDAGTMLVCFMERNNDRWPRDWDELAASIKPDDDCVFCHSGSPDDRKRGYPQTIGRLKRMVRIDWDFVPNPGMVGHPVTTIRGKRFAMVWEGAEPNEMVYHWITHRRRDSIPF